MPIDRPDGRHWCDPASETPDEHGTWACACTQVWHFDPSRSTWVPEAEWEAYQRDLEALATATATAEAEED